MSVIGRSEEEAETLVGAGHHFLEERAKLGKLSSYTEMNATLERRTGLRGFDFSMESERTAMGQVLGIITEQDIPTSGVMLSSLVSYLDQNDAGPGFYKLATRLGLLPAKASAEVRLDFWAIQVARVHDHYKRTAATP